MKDEKSATVGVPLWRCPRDHVVELEDGTRLMFYHVDSLYSLCKTTDGQYCHPIATTIVRVVRPMTEAERA